MKEVDGEYRLPPSLVSSPASEIDDRNEKKRRRRGTGIQADPYLSLGTRNPTRPPIPAYTVTHVSVETMRLVDALPPLGVES